MKNAFLIFFFFPISLYATSVKLCHYQTWDWSTKENRSVNHRQVIKPYSELNREEKGSISGCTLCEEDQVEIKISEVPPFKICKIYENQIEEIILKAKEDHFPFYSIIAYRVGKSLGPIDFEGKRTKYSQHSYGLAIDFNSKLNGMYNSCVSFNSKCKLIHGGNYEPDRPGAITSESKMGKALQQLGFNWGGHLVGRQKDFMHFSRE